MITLDSNVFIYVLENNQEFGERASLVLESAQDNGLASMFVYLELLSHSGLEKAENKELVLRFLDEQRLEFVELKRDILLKAAELRAQLTPKLGVGDALHLATAIHAGAEEFVTNDQNLVKLKIKDLKITSL